jgi:hypothetical protein
VLLKAAVDVVPVVAVVLVLHMVEVDHLASEVQSAPMAVEVWT